MGEHTSRRLNASFHALSHPTLREMIGFLRQGETRVTDLAKPFDISLNTVSKHIKVLEKAGLVERTVRGREHCLKLSTVPLKEIADWVSHYQQYWTERIDALEQLLLERKAAKAAAAANQSSTMKKAKE